MDSNIKNIDAYDLVVSENENLPDSFIVEFNEIEIANNFYVKIIVNGKQAGDVINDNSEVEDFYRYHDIFHYTFATLLDWSPCTRALLHKKRKSIPKVDEFEDGARAAITEEAISLMVFNEAKRTNFFKKNVVSPTILEIIKEMTEPFEVNRKTKADWTSAILVGYKLFQELVLRRGGRIEFSRINRKATFLA